MSPIIKVTTKSGSVYLVHTERKKVHRTGGAHYKGRAADGEWEPYEAIHFELGQPMTITWGFGRDQYSAALGTPEDIPDEEIVRQTSTSRVVSIEPQGC